jgi:hypothetical protein
VPQLYLTSRHFLTHASTSPGLTFWRGIRWGLSEGPMDLVSRLHVQRTTPSNLGTIRTDPSYLLSVPSLKERRVDGG